MDVFECKWSPDEFSPDALKVFRAIYPKGANFLLCPVSKPYKKAFGSLTITVTSYPGAVE